MMRLADAYQLRRGARDTPMDASEPQERVSNGEAQRHVATHTQKPSSEMIAEIAVQRAHHLPVFRPPPRAQRVFGGEADRDIHIEKNWAKLVFEGDVYLKPPAALARDGLVLGAATSKGPPTATAETLA
jgi:hypothetical protein